MKTYKLLSWSLDSTTENRRRHRKGGYSNMIIEWLSAVVSNECHIDCYNYEKFLK